MQLHLLAQLCSVCDDTGDASPTAAETTGPSATKSNAESVESLLAAMRSAERLPGLVLRLVRRCMQHLQPKELSSTPGLLPEALPGEAPGCGELLNSSKPAVRSIW